MKFRIITLAAVVAGAMTLTACGSDNAATPGSAASGTGSSSTPCGAGGASSAAGSSAAGSSAAGSSAAGSSAAGTAGAASKLLADAKAGKLTIGIKYDQPGLGMKMPDNTFAGFDVDVAKYVAKQLGVPDAGVTFAETKSAEREDKIAKGEVDFIVGTYSITATRQQKVDFAGPYFIAHQDLLVKADNTDITGPDCLNGKILCSVTGSTSASKVKESFSKDAALQEFGTYSECVAQLKAGVVDAVTTDDAILAGYAAQDAGQFKVVGKGFTDEKYGVGLMKGDTEGNDKITAALKAMVKDGSWKKSLDANVGPSGYKIPEPPANMTS